MSATDDEFAPVWDEDSLARQRRLLQQVLRAAESCGIRLFLSWGTLLGYVREGRILAWDDDLDLAFFDPADDYAHRLREALVAEGVSTHEHVPAGWRTIKAYNPTSVVQTHNPWTWPFIDIYPYPEVPPLDESMNTEWPVPRELILPGRLTIFENLQVWEPEHPLPLLDRQYPGWRTCEKSTYWNHRLECQNGPVVSRAIVTDDYGRKITGEATSDMDKVLEARVRRAIESHFKGRTILLIRHPLDRVAH